MALCSGITLANAQKVIWNAKDETQVGLVQDSYLLYYSSSPIFYFLKLFWTSGQVSFICRTSILAFIFIFGSDMVGSHICYGALRSLLVVFGDGYGWG